MPHQQLRFLWRQFDAEGVEEEPGQLARLQFTLRVRLRVRGAGPRPGQRVELVDAAGAEALDEGAAVERGVRAGGDVVVGQLVVDGVLGVSVICASPAPVAVAVVEGPAVGARGDLLAAQPEVPPLDGDLVARRTLHQLDGGERLAPKPMSLSQRRPSSSTSIIAWVAGRILSAPDCTRPDRR